MKRDAAEYVALCDTGQMVKAEHQRPAAENSRVEVGRNQHRFYTRAAAYSVRI
jgi:hypothetical protein